MNYFYSPQPFIKGGTFYLSEEESSHAVRVLRMSVGNSVTLINGLGQSASAIIIGLTGKQTEVRIEEILEEKIRPVKVNIGLALLKSRERMEWFIEKAIELGASEIILFTSARTEKKTGNSARFNKIAVSALKQSGNLWLPEIRADVSFNELVKNPFEGQKFIAYCEDEPEAHLKNAFEKGENCLILIGPEGDFTKEEIKEAESCKFVPVSLGKLRLRSETAALAALITANVINED